MYLKTLVGPYAGKVMEFSPEAARAMLADGRAVRAFTEPESVEIAPTVSERLAQTPDNKHRARGQQR